MVRSVMRGFMAAFFIGTVVYGWLTHKRQAGENTAQPQAAGDVLPASGDLLDDLAPYLMHPDWRVRLSGIHRIAALRQVEAAPYLLDRLNDADSDVRQAAAQGVIALGSASVPGLLTVLETGGMNAREAAAAALGAVGDPVALPGLLAALHDESAWVRLPVVRALGVVGDGRVVPALTGVLKADTDADVRQAAVVALRQIGTPAALDAIKPRSA